MADREQTWIPLSVPNLAGNGLAYVSEAVREEWVSTGGAYVDGFEKSLTKFLHAPAVAACQSGTAALHLSLLACGVGPGDVVIVPTLTFIAAANPVRYQFAEPVFMDCDSSLCMDPAKLREFCRTQCTFRHGKLTYHGKQVKAVIIVHVFGNMADMEALMDICMEYGLKAIEDATEALGTRYRDGCGRYSGMYAGTIGDFGAFSFNGNKIITTGGGGAVTARDAADVRYMKYLSTQAKDDPDFYIHNEVGYNYRMTNLQAALGAAQMERLAELIRAKQENYALYGELFRDFRYGRLLPFCGKVWANCWFYSLQVDRAHIHAPIREIVALLAKRGIQARAIWGLIHEQKPYRAYTAYRIKEAVCFSGSVFNIPCSTNLTKEDILYVAEETMALLEGMAEGA